MASRRKAAQPGKDEDFYSTLAADFDDSEEESAVSDADVAALAQALGDLDDMDDALTTLKSTKTISKEGDLSKKGSGNGAKDPKGGKAGTPSPALIRQGTYNLGGDISEDEGMFETQDLGKMDASKDLPEAPSPLEAKSSSLAKTFPGRSRQKSPSKSFDFGEFDEDDPLAGLLSDDEDDPKPKKKPQPKPAKKAAPVKEIEKSPEKSKEPPPLSKQKAVRINTSDDDLDGTNVDSKPAPAEKSRKADSKPAKQPSRKKDDIDFDDDDDGILGGMGFDDTPRDKPKKTAKLDEEQEAAKAKVSELFGKTSILDKPPASRGRMSDFSLDPKYRKPEKAPAKEPTEEDFTFGGYTPSTITKRPESAPLRRSVRFADNDDDDDIFGNSTMDRPRRAGSGIVQQSPSKSSSKEEAGADDWLDEAAGLGSTFPLSSKEKVESKPAVKSDSDKTGTTSGKVAKGGGGGGGKGEKEEKRPASAADYLGLGGDDVDIDSIAPSKQVTPRTDTTSPFPWESGSPRRSGRTGDLSSTGDLGSTFDSLNFSNDGDDDDDDILNESDPMRASLIAQQIKQLAALERNDPPPPEQKPAPSSKPPPSSTLPPPGTDQPSMAASKAREMESPNPMSMTAPLQRQSSTTSIGDQKPGRREPKWRQELRLQQQQQQGSITPATQSAQSSPVRQPDAATRTTGGTPLAATHSTSGGPHVAAPTSSGMPYTSATPTTSGMPQAASTPFNTAIGVGLGPTSRLDSAGPGLDASVLTEGQAQMERQRQSMLEFEASLKQQQAQMAAENERQMQLIQEQRQKALLQQQQQALKQQQEQQQAMQQQMLKMQQQMLHPGPGPGPGPSFGLDTSYSGLGGTAPMAMSGQHPSWFENKVRQLEAEKTQLEASMELSGKHHKQQLATLETSHKEYVDLLEAGSKRREARLLQEAEEASRRQDERLQALVQERSKVVSEHQARMQKVYEEHGREMDQIKQIHQREMETHRQQNKVELEETRKTMQHHLESLKDTGSHTQSLKTVIDRFGVVGDQINSLQGRVSDQHQSQLDNRLQEVREKEEETKRMRRRLEEQETAMSLERERLQATVSRLETHIKEQNMQLDEERWRMRQEQNKLSALQKVMEEERKMVAEQLASQQASLQQAKNAVLTEQQTIMGQCMEERKALATERAQFAAARREWEITVKEEMSKVSQDQATREGTMESLVTERGQLGSLRETLHKDRASLEQRHQEAERQEQELEQERGRLQRLGDSLQVRSRELQGMVSDAVGVREEGEKALVKARQIEAQHNARIQTIEHMQSEIRETERIIADERLQLAEERKSLERSAGSLLCQQCGLLLSMQNVHASRPSGLPAMNTFPFLNDQGFEGGRVMHTSLPNQGQGGDPMSPVIVDRLLAQAELDRTKNVWKLAAEKDKDFLEEETSFLESLNTSYKLSQLPIT